MKKTTLLILIVSLLSLLGVNPATAATQKKAVDAVVIASFGTSYPEALEAILTIDKEMRKEFPKAEIKHAFTSNIIRGIWHERAGDAAWKKANRSVPEWLYEVKGPLATFGALQEEGKKRVVVQTTHVYAGEEYLDLKAYVDAVAGIDTLRAKWKPFSFMTLGRPALGKAGVHPEYHADIEKAAETLAGDVKKAQKMGAVLVYMGHGNEVFPSSAYIEFQKAMNAMYPEVTTLVGTVEGYPSLDEVTFALKHMKAKKVFMKPFMVVAGDHARNDMAGDEDDAWKTVMEKMGVKVTCELKGLGENPEWAKIYAKHAVDAVTVHKGH
ncbi:sirohydrochlorin cobaltochelatase [Desulfoluna spongiiphila]|uniref:Sirohydrochlorin cobaltochelatase n=1 Tax=Desulfoluna spongiiphila TaxID=419481 RepID=A0A1G5JD11_9BACT|nr:sirohydrochlorin cobaltochelatase [Desulfoluna spongiiphila]SCY85830.1 sirohydrochlorin cobaltochelatase [Desulfoluna spongiiphila]